MLRASGERTSPVLIQVHTEGNLPACDALISTVSPSAERGWTEETQLTLTAWNQLGDDDSLFIINDFGLIGFLQRDSVAERLMPEESKNPFSFKWHQHSAK